MHAFWFCGFPFFQFFIFVTHCRAPLAKTEGTELIVGVLRCDERKYVALVREAGATRASPIIPTCGAFSSPQAMRFMIFRLCHSGSPRFAREDMGCDVDVGGYPMVTGTKAMPHPTPLCATTSGPDAAQGVSYSAGVFAFGLPSPWTTPKSTPYPLSLRAKRSNPGGAKTDTSKPRGSPRRQNSIKQRDCRRTTGLWRRATLFCISRPISPLSTK